MWEDGRLAFENATQVKTLPDPSKYIWIPRYSVQHTLMSTTSGILGGEPFRHATIQNDGRVFYVEFNEYKLRCNMQLKNFPFDIQCCQLIFTPASMAEDTSLSLMDKYPVVCYGTECGVNKLELTGIRKLL